MRKNIRLIVQLCWTVLTNGYVKGFLSGKIYTGRLKSVCLPGLNCYSCPGALGACPLGSLQSALAARNVKFPLYIVGFLLIIGTVLGRFVCGWLCPFGLVQDLLYKIPFVKKMKKLPGDRVLKLLKYVALVLFVIVLPLFAADATGLGTTWFCKYICPSGTLGAGVPLAILNDGIRETVSFLFAWKSLLLVIAVVLSVIVYRPFCRYLCPLGAIYGLFNRVSVYRYKVDKEKCTSCGVCRKACKCDISVWENPNSADCIRCGECLKACPHAALECSIGKKRSENKSADSEDKE